MPYAQTHPQSKNQNDIKWHNIASCLKTTYIDLSKTIIENVG